jgi:predicted nucleic acid-binding protein
MDTPLFIYYIEGHPDYFETCGKLFDQVDAGVLSAVTSVVTMLEVLVHPLRHGNWELAKQYRDILLNSSGLAILDVNVAISERAAELRARYEIRTTDAIQLATALVVRARAFVTSDQELVRVEELPVILMEKAS